MKMRLAAVLWIAFCLLPISCGGNNIGRLFDPDVDDGGGGGSADASNIVAVAVGGKAIDGRPKVVEAFPTGGEWPTTVPIVVVFNESVNANSVAPSGQSARETVYVRASGTEQPLPAIYDFLLGDTVVVIRPAQPLVTPEGGSFEVVVEAGMRDSDGIRFAGSSADPSVVATFTTDAPDGAVDGEIVTVLPLDNSDSQVRETPIYAIFSRAATQNTVTTANFVVRTSAGAGVAGSLSFPLESAPTVTDTRVLRFDPNAALAATTTYEIVVNETIQFGSTGVLEFRGRVPWASFSTTGPAAVTDIGVGNDAPGFLDKVNLGNFSNLVIDVDTPADTIAGDRVRVRIYGLDAETAANGDLGFIERTGTASANGVQTVSVPFDTTLGTVNSPRFEDGALTLTAQIQRGRSNSGFARPSSSNDPAIDLMRPSLVSLGPPAGPTPTDIVTDQQFALVYGTASERLGGASLNIGATTTALYGSSSDGRFVIAPIDVGVQPGAAVGYTLSLTDAAGNVMATPVSGNVLQRGVVSGVQAGTLTVEAYNDADFAPIAGATVIIEPGAPQKPAVGQLSGITDASGRASFTGLGNATYSITIVADGFHLVSLLETAGAFVSMPLRPQTNPTGGVSGSLAFAPVPTQTVRVGTNVFDDPTLEMVETSSSTPGTLAEIQVRPNRPILATGFAGAFPPTSLATFASFGCGMCGANSLTPTPPFTPPTPGQSSSISLTLIGELPAPAAPAVVNLNAPFAVDFATSGGLGAISGTPTANVVSSVTGFAGMPLMGVGFATSTGGTTYSVNGSLFLRPTQLMLQFPSTLWVSTEARDADGNVARVRRLVLDPTTGTTAATTVAPGIPTLAVPGGPITGSPSVAYTDRLDATALIGGFAVAQLRATDAANRRWDVLWVDSDNAAGATSVQMPDLSGQAVTGLATGAWTVQIENFLFFTVGMTATSFTFEERFRQLVAYAKAKSETFTIQ